MRKTFTYIFFSCIVLAALACGRQEAHHEGVIEVRLTDGRIVGGIV